MKAKIVNGAYTIATKIKAEDLKKLIKYKSDALSLKDEKGNVYYLAQLNEASEGSVTKNGIIFNEVSADGYVQLTKCFERPVDMDKRKDTLKDIYMVCAEKLEKLEAQILKEAKDLKDYEERILENITID